MNATMQGELYDGDFANWSDNHPSLPGLDVRCCVLRKTTFGPSRAGEFTNRKRSGKTVKDRKHRSFNLVSFASNEPILRWGGRWKKGTSWKTNFLNCKGIHNFKISEENKIATGKFGLLLVSLPIPPRQGTNLSLQLMSAETGRVTDIPNIAGWFSLITYIDQRKKKATPTESIELLVFMQMS